MMIHKNIFFFSAVMTAAMCSVSCNNEKYLTAEQYDDIPLYEMYKNDDNAIMGMNAVYDMMVPDGSPMNIEGQNTGEWGFKPNLFTGSHPTNDTQATGWDKDWNNQNWSVSNAELLNGWKHVYIGISRANYFLEGLKHSTGVSDDVKKVLEGEGRAARAFFYHWLAITFGRVPELAPCETYESHPAKERVSTYEKMWNIIINDLDTASRLLDWTPLNGQYGRCTKGMALSYLGDAYMWKAYRLSDGCNGQKKDETAATECYVKAREVLGQVLNSKVYELNPSFTTLWDMAGVWGKEAIWEEVLDEGTNWGNQSNFTSHMYIKNYTACPENGGWGSLFISWEWWSLFEKGDKRRQGSACIGAVPQIDPSNPAYESKYDGWYEKEVYGYHPYLQTVIGKEENSQTHQFHFYNGEYAPSIWCMKLWRNARAGRDGDDWSPAQIYWKRLPNVMLDYAECCFRLGDDVEGWKQIQKLRERAFGNLEVGRSQELTNKYLPPIRSLIKFYIDKGQSGVIPEEYPIPFNDDTVSVPDAKTYYTRIKAEKGYVSKVWKVAVNIERRKEFNCEWSLCPDMHKSGFLKDHIEHAYPKYVWGGDPANDPWSERQYEYNELKMDMPIPSDEIIKNKLCDQNAGY